MQCSNDEGWSFIFNKLLYFRRISLVKMKVITSLENYVVQSSLISFPSYFSILHLNVCCFLKLLKISAVFAWVWALQQQPLRGLRGSADCRPADTDIILALNSGKSKAYGSRFCKQGSNTSLTYAGITQLAFTVVVLNLYWGKEVRAESDLCWPKEKIIKL